MALEQFFEDGNRLAVIGSYVWIPDEAFDLDFTLFTHGGENPFPCNPEESPEIREFLNQEFGRIAVPLNFAGLRYEEGEDKAYNIDNLPTKKPKVCGYYLTGKFFTDRQFLEDHFRDNFGDEFILDMWEMISTYVAGFRDERVRLKKRHKNLMLLITAAEQVAASYPTVAPIAEKYRKSYVSAKKYLKSGRYDFWEYQMQMDGLLESFVGEVNACLRKSG